MKTAEPGLHITVVAHDIGPIGGMERQLTELTTGLLGRGHRVTVISRRCDLPAQSGLRWIRVPGPARPFPVAYPWFFLAGTWQVWRHRAGLVHTTGAITWNRVDVCTIHHCHLGSQGESIMASSGRSMLYRINRRFSAALARLGERLVYRTALVRHVVAVSEGVAREVCEHFARIAANTSVIPNAVDHQVFRPDPVARDETRARYGFAESDLVALFVGGDWEWKGLPVAIRAVAATPGCHLLVVGSGNEDRYRELARELGSEDRIHFAGRQKRTARYYAAADVFVLPSVYEAFPLVVCEAAASGLPLLMTRVSGVAEILSDGENGWFIERDPNQVAGRLSILRDHGGLRRSMGARSREAVTRYSWPRVVDDYVQVYRRLLEDSHEGADRSGVLVGIRQ